MWISTVRVSMSILSEYPHTEESNSSLATGLWLLRCKYSRTSISRFVNGRLFFPISIQRFCKSILRFSSSWINVNSVVSGILRLNTDLILKQADFAGFVKALPSKKRRKLRVDQKALAQAGAYIEVCDDPSAISDDLYRLYKKTAEKKSQRLILF